MRMLVPRVAASFTEAHQRPTRNLAKLLSKDEQQMQEIRLRPG